MKDNNKLVVNMPFKDVLTYLAVVVRVARAMLYRGVVVSPPTTLCSNSPASLVDILF